jgi:hypothetical protein
LRKDLAELPGRKYHKKKNLIKQFLNLYPDHVFKPMTLDLVPHAKTILEQWHSAKFNNYEDENNETGYDDFEAATDALENFEILNLKGAIVYVKGEPAAYCLGEPIINGTMFTVQFEKAIESYKGIYQFINQAFAASLPEDCTWNPQPSPKGEVPLLINREQDLGTEGLRKAKMSYKPFGFVKKYTAKYSGEQK